MSTDKSVSIKCKSAAALDLKDIKAFQGNLKDLSIDNYNKLKKEILSHGFSEPISVWVHNKTNHCLNGHQRLRVLLGLREEGYFVPPIPVSIIEARDEKEAKEKVLALTSQYGEITDQGLYEFMETAKIDFSFLDNMSFPEIDLNKWKDEFVELGEGQEADLSEPKTEFDHECPSCGLKF